MSDDKLPLTSHLEELRKRLLICLAAVGVGFALAYGFSEQLFEILSRPLTRIMPDDSSFIFTGLTEAFFTYLKLAFFAGLGLATPVILHQVWRFVSPGLYENERKSAVPFVLLATLFFVVGVLFGYFQVLPIAFKFFLGYNSEHIRMLPSIKLYLSFTCKFLLAFGIVFELPIIILFLSRIGLVTHHQLRANRRIVIVAIFIVAAFLTPPDVVSQTLMAVPLLVLYEISIVIARIFGKKPAADEVDDADPDEDPEDSDANGEPTGA